MAERVYTVSQVNAYLSGVFQQNPLLRRLRVRGELSNVKYHSSGHIYFTLKDAGGSLSAVMFASRRQGLSFRLSDGLKVVAEGSVGIYERGGTYQFYAVHIEEEGRGDLYAAYLKRKAQLEEMGMFAPEYKKPIPKFVSTVGIVTSPTGAAVRDIINISTRRDPYIQLVLYPALVQGERAADSIVRGIKTLDRYGVDVIIAGRGGGSIEDLWAFNEEKVARAIFDCRTPLVSAVGHETDFTIADFVADLRAPTPSAAAELCVPDMARFLTDLEAYRSTLLELLKRQILRTRQRERELALMLRLRSPEALIREKRQRTADFCTAAETALRRKYADVRHRFEKDADKLNVLSPLNRLKGGFAYISDERDRAVKAAEELTPGEIVRITFSDGRAEAAVRRVSARDRKEATHG